jgi:hypothetical protein
MFHCWQNGRSVPVPKNEVFLFATSHAQTYKYKKYIISIETAEKLDNIYNLGFCYRGEQFDRVK